MLWGCAFFLPDVKGDHPGGGAPAGPLPEPSANDAAYDMILQTYCVISTPSGERFAGRRCTYVDGLPDACEIVFVDRGTVIAAVPTYRRGGDEWSVQAKHATRAVARAIEQHFRHDRVALDRRGILGMRSFPEGPVSAVVVDDEVRLQIDNGATLAVAKLPPGLISRGERYVSIRAPDLYVVSLSAESASNRDRREGYLVFRRSGPGDVRTVNVIGPLHPALGRDLERSPRAW